MVDFSQNNTSPTLTAQDQNFDVQVFLVPKSAGLTIASTSGWRRPGTVKPGTYQPNEPTGVNSTKLGTTQSTKSQHINSQELSIPLQMDEITPWGQACKNKTDLTQTYTAGVKTTTIAAAGGGVQFLTLSAIGTFAVGDKLAIPISSGNAAYISSEKRIDAIAPTGYGANTVQLDFPLDEAPAAGVTVTDIVYHEGKKGGSRLLKLAMQATISGDFDDTIIQNMADARVIEGQNSFPVAATGMTTMTLSSIAATESIDGRLQPVMMTERIIA